MTSNADRGSRRPVVVKLTVAEAGALARLAECAGNTYEDAKAVLDNAASVGAGYRAIEKLNKAIVAAVTP